MIIIIIMSRSGLGRGQSTGLYERAVSDALPGLRTDALRPCTPENYVLNDYGLFKRPWLAPSGASH